MPNVVAPVLLIGGSGVVGSQAARALRRLQPRLPIAIGARDVARAQAVATAIGDATMLPIDIASPDIGLSSEQPVSLDRRQRSELRARAEDRRGEGTDMRRRILKPLTIVSMLLAGSAGGETQAPRLGFFVTSVGIGDGANLGGLVGADAHCQKLATAVGAGDRTWRAYLSATASDARPAVHARDRIGRGPWHNAKGVLIARDLSDLHDASTAKMGATLALTERGTEVDGEQHDILTGSNADGTLASGGSDTTCGNWTSTRVDGSAMMGHHDLLSGQGTPRSWNAAHPSKGCGQPHLVDTGGNGYFYCFAAD